MRDVISGAVKPEAKRSAVKVGLWGGGREGFRVSGFSPVLSSLHRSLVVLRVLVILGTGVFMTGCLSDSGTSPEKAEPWTIPAGPQGWPAIAWPAENPYSPAKAALGKELFFDTRLSSDGVISCSWCHSERASFTDNHGMPFSTGVGQVPTRRNTPTLVNVAFGTSFLLAGELATLEEQAVSPLLARDEMNMTAESIESFLSADTAYVRKFQSAFGPLPITLANVAKALATFQRTLISAQASYDNWRAGDSAAMTPAQKRGYALFAGKAGCVACHVPPLFTDQGFYNVGLDSVIADSGRAHVTGLVSDAGKFKTPTLRNILVTYPYMHDGRFQELRDVVEHFNSGGQAHPVRDSRIRPLGLTYDEVSELVAFLGALTDQNFLERHNP